MKALPATSNAAGTTKLGFVNAYTPDPTTPAMTNTFGGGGIPVDAEPTVQPADFMNAFLRMDRMAMGGRGARLETMHVITGRFKGAPLTTPLSVTRPTTDRTKEALFSRLESRGLLQDARVLDLFGGTGALGIEALSRGARELVVVEANAQAAKLIAGTLTALKRHHGWEEGIDAHVVRAKAERYAAKAKVDAPFDLVLIDPPYMFATNDCARLLDDLVGRGLVGKYGAIVLERSKRTAPPTPPAGWVEDDRRDYGETTVYTYRSNDYEWLVDAQRAD